MMEKFEKAYLVYHSTYDMGTENFEGLFASESWALAYCLSILQVKAELNLRLYGEEKGYHAISLSDWQQIKVFREREYYTFGLAFTIVEMTVDVTEPERWDFVSERRYVEKVEKNRA